MGGERRLIEERPRHSILYKLERLYHVPRDGKIVSTLERTNHQGQMSEVELTSQEESEWILKGAKERQKKAGTLKRKKR